MVHLQENGFQAEKVGKTDSELMAIKGQSGITPQLASCHTAVVDGYVIEGHVPADVVRRLLKERPAIKGLTVPGMPVGSPGMEVPSGVQEPYQVLAFDERGNVFVYESRP